METNTQTTTATEQTRDIVATIDVASWMLTIRAINGVEIRVNATELTEDIRSRALLHGLKQKIVDAAAISRDPDTGKSATIRVKVAAMQAVADRLHAGFWNAVREGAGPRVGILVQALCRLYPAKAAAEIREWLDKKTKEETAALRANPQVAAEINTIRAELAEKSGVDADGLLNELEDN